MKRFVYLLLMLTASTVFCGDAKVVFHDEFEQGSTASPPPGWAMCGVDQYKTPSNYTRDTINAHGGQACFRIHHPAKSVGYIVSSPDRAINPKPAMVYAVSFWARAEKPGKATFRWTAYRSIKPFVDAPSPGTFTFDAGGGWKEFSFTVREGLDLFADQSPFLMLTFIAATESGE